MSETPDEFFNELKKYKNVAVENLSSHPPETKPDWYDAELLARGQQFIRKHYWNISLSELESLYILFAFNENLDALIYTRQSDTIETASKRYYETVVRVKSWYESDPWDRESEAYRNIVVVRSLHSNASRKLNSKRKDVVEKELETIKAAWGGGRGGGCPVAYLDKTSRRSKKSDNLEFLRHSDKYITQPEMTLTLFGFMGLTTLYPEKLGIFNVTDQDLTAFVHFWRTIGHLLGIQDDINICRGSLEDVKRRCRACVDETVIPRLYELNKDWEHMSKCMILGSQKFLPLIDFETTLMYLFWILELPYGELTKTVSLWTRLKFAFCLFNVKYLQRIAYVKQIMNKALINLLDSFGRSNTFEKLKYL